ncbi:cyclin-domain-containing protein [Delitschia confertaspora ATCC 74209]|uniref:Cyclin-domain-containing protein n=1 Tax=Delitschia confertaspora ATCC 74209 TaxID=1513339 RepID=A0A9P4MUM6_9PLEO|nr:cyclin-domain-containing protein [Delitschia confertaspora ATCC 74209]
MLTSSPTISAPSSPSAAFHVHNRSYHASRRTSASSSTHSPRFYPQVSSAPSRRFEPPPVPSTPAPTQSQSIVAFARSPQIKRKEYSDAGTQYTPPGFPPTHHPTSLANLPSLEKSTPSQETPRTSVKRRETSAEPPVTDPPEPNLRIDPPPDATEHGSRNTATLAADAEMQEAGQQPDTRQNEEGARNQTRPSPPKRARPRDPDVKVMPLKYETCDVRELGALISDMLMELIRINDAIPLRDGQLTRFHSRAPPAISVRDYLTRLIVHATLSPPILLSMVYYVDQLCALYPAFTVSSLTVHRFLITAATVAAKGLSDSFWTNGLYAKVGGVSIKELALLELEFLRRVDWKIVPVPETLVDYYKWLVDRGEGYMMESGPDSGDSEKAPSSSSDGETMNQ